MSVYLVSRLRLRAIGCMLLGAGAFAMSWPAWLQNSQASAQGVSCFLSPAKLSDEAVSQFLANPASLLAVHGNGGITFVNLVRTLAGSDVRTVDSLIELARNAAPGIKADVAAGLANTAASCSWTRPDITQLIQEKIDASQDSRLIALFFGAAAAIQTAAVRDAPAGGADIGGTAIGSGSRVEPNAARQGGGLAGFAGTERKSFAASKSNSARNSGNTNSPSNTIGSSTSNLDNIVRSSETVRSNSSNSISRLFTPDGPVSQTVQ